MYVCVVIIIFRHSTFTFGGFFMATRRTFAPKKDKITKGEYEHRVLTLRHLEEEVDKLKDQKINVAQDGTDDENPAYGQICNELAAAQLRVDNARQLLFNIEIVEEEFEEGCLCESAKSVRLKSIFAEDDIEDEVLRIGRDNCDITPGSPLFNFLRGKKAGFKGYFENPNGVSYSVEIITINF